MSGPESLLWERWEEIDRLLSEALDLPPEAREAHVRRGLGDDPALGDLVGRLVARLAADHDRVVAPAASLVAAAFGPAATGDREADLPAGTDVGRYRILGQRARGGMATVYEAERNDGAYRQRVALKVLRRGLDTDDLVRRFRTERQILSSLSHPNIARLLDGGSTPDGRPYLVMELVDGQPITANADERRLEVRRRLGLFLAVTDAVHAAHRQLVVHRDIKPSNILVDGDGRVKLLDFGIAKLVAEDGEHTAVEARALTPDYASPEQLQGGAISTAADVYQLGLLLRELLTGVRPGALGREDPAPRPSRLASRTFEGAAQPEERAAARGTTPTRLARELAGDLDLIVDKALRSDPEARYTSAEELGSDIRRHLRGQPIRAHPESARYRMGKFVRRHWAGVAALIGAMVILLGYAITVTVQSRLIITERDRAEQEARKAREVTEFLVQLFHGADPNQTGGEQVTARELLDVGVREIDADSHMEPAVRAAMLAAIGRSYDQLGLYGEARAVLERALLERHAAHGPEHLAVADDLNSLAQVVSGMDRDSGLALFDRALKTSEAVGGAEHPLTGRILADYGATLAQGYSGRQRGTEMVHRAVAILRKAPAEHRADLAHALAVSAYGQAPAVGIPLLREALEIRRAIHGEYHTTVAGSLSDLGLATEVVDPIAADSLLEQAMRIMVAIHGERHGGSLGIMNNLAGVRRDRGAHAEAEPLYRRVLELRRELHPERRLPQAYALYGLGLTQVGSGRPVEGEARLREALGILREEVPGSPLVDFTQAAIGQALAAQGRFAEAERLLIPASRAVQGAAVHPIDRARILKLVVRLYQDWGRTDQGEVYRARLDSLVAAEPLAGYPIRN